MIKKQVQIMGINRHRINVDGPGVVSLVALYGCHLDCKYCLNKECHNDKYCKEMSARELYDALKIDNMYFLYSGGGITFGGGEPLLQSDFIMYFKRICHTKWKINIETSLNVPIECIKPLLAIVDLWIVDIKDLNPIIYKSYTGLMNDYVLDNLKLLCDYNIQCKCLIRIPLIPNFNNIDDVIKTKELLHNMGFVDCEVFEYDIYPIKSRTSGLESVWKQKGN